MVAPTYANSPLSFLLSNADINGRFAPKMSRFFSLFSVTLLTVQEAIFNEINDLRGGGLQAEIGGGYPLHLTGRLAGFEGWRLQH